SAASRCRKAPRRRCLRSNNWNLHPSHVTDPEEQMARLAPITGKNQVPAEDHGIVDFIVSSRGGIQGPFKMLLHCPKLAGRGPPLGADVRFEGKLDKRVGGLAGMAAGGGVDPVVVWGAPTRAAPRGDVRGTTEPRIPRT